MYITYCTITILRTYFKTQIYKVILIIHQYGVMHNAYRYFKVLYCIYNVQYPKFTCTGRAINITELLLVEFHLFKLQVLCTSDLHHTTKAIHFYTIVNLQDSNRIY